MERVSTNVGYKQLSRGGGSQYVLEEQEKGERTKRKQKWEGIEGKKIPLYSFVFLCIHSAFSLDCLSCLFRRLIRKDLQSLYPEIVGCTCICNNGARQFRSESKRKLVILVCYQQYLREVFHLLTQEKDRQSEFREKGLFVRVLLFSIFISKMKLNNVDVDINIIVNKV